MSTYIGPKTESPYAFQLPSALPTAEDSTACYSLAAEVHRATRSAVQHAIRPDWSLEQLVEFTESQLRNFTAVDPNNPLDRGQAFPTGVSSGRVAAHYTTVPGVPSLQTVSEGVLCLDFGVHFHRHLVDCAFSFTFDPQLEPLVQATREATWSGIKAAGAEVRVCDVGAAVRETMESFTVRREPTNEAVAAKEEKVKVIKNLNGHSIGRYIIHAGKTVPGYDNGDKTRMKAGEVFAIETFGSTGKGMVEDFGENSHFMVQKEARNLRSKSAVAVYQAIAKRFGSLAFTQNWLQDVPNYKFGLSMLVKGGYIETFPPLADVKGSETSQLEHTLLISEEGVNVVSRGTDY